MPRLRCMGAVSFPLAISTLHGQQPGAEGRSTGEARPSLLVRVGGRARSVQRQTDDVASIFRRFGAINDAVIDGDDAAKMWRQIRDLGWTDEDTPVAGIRASVLPSDIPQTLDSLPDTQESSGLRWTATTQTAQGIIDIHWFGADAEPSSDHVTAAISRTIQSVRRVGGTAVVTHAPTPIKVSLDVWGESTSAIDTMRNLKRQYDPDRRLNPGRFMGGI